MRISAVCACLWISLIFANAGLAGEPDAAGAKPLFKNFMGVCGHTVQFKPELYKATCGLVRDYHPIDWDFGNDTSYATKFPMARNQVDWNQVYGSWKKSGYTTDVSAMFDNMKPESWKDLPKDAKAYGAAFARYFGPSGQNLVSSVEIGNEPGKYNDTVYRTMFESMASGLREGDPKMLVATCACVAGKSHAYAKSVTCFEGLENLFDAINIHTYAQVKGWPTWERSYPEDPKIPYLKDVDAVIAWREKHAAGKQIWITEFGWDASTKQPPKTGDFAKWVGSTETQQAQYLVRSFMVFSKMPVDRAYIYFFNDSDQPQMHGSAGLTRDFKPKPAFHAVAHLYSTLGQYRFARSIEEKTGEVYAYEFTHADDRSKKIWAVWSPTGSARQGEVTLPLAGFEVVKAEQMPLTAGAPAAIEIKKQDGNIVVPVGESPIYVMLQAKGP